MCVLYLSSNKMAVKSKNKHLRLIKKVSEVGFGVTKSGATNLAWFWKLKDFIFLEVDYVTNERRSLILAIMPP